MKQPNYMPLLVRKANELALRGPGAYQVTTFHDEWCDFWDDPGQCNCEPVIGRIWREPDPGEG